jgi:hypothetical protein
MVVVHSASSRSCERTRGDQRTVIVVLPFNLEPSSARATHRGAVARRLVSITCAVPDLYYPARDRSGGRGRRTRAELSVPGLQPRRGAVVGTHPRGTTVQQAHAGSCGTGGGSVSRLGLAVARHRGESQAEPQRACLRRSRLAPSAPRRCPASGAPGAQRRASRRGSAAPASDGGWATARTRLRVSCPPRASARLWEGVEGMHRASRARGSRSATRCPVQLRARGALEANRAERALLSPWRPRPQRRARASAARMDRGAGSLRPQVRVNCERESAWWAEQRDARRALSAAPPHAARVREPRRRRWMRRSLC